MTTQAIAENKPSYVPVVATTAIGGALGGTVFAPAKYKNYEALVAEATSADKFELKQLADGASDETKTAYNAVKDSLETTKKQLKDIDEAFKAPEGGKAPEALGYKEIATKLGIANAPENEAALKTLKQNNAVAEALSKIAKDGEIKITDDLKGIFNAGETKGTAEQVQSAFKAITGADFAEGTKMTEDMQKSVSNYISGNKEALALAEKATAKDGALTLTKEAAEGYVKQGTSAVQEAFGKLGKTLGKSVGKGIAWGAGIGLVVGLLYKMFSGKKEAA